MDLKKFNFFFFNASVMSNMKAEATLTEAFYGWLQKNVDLVKYIQIDSNILPETDQEMKNYTKEKEATRLTLLGLLTNFLNLKLLARKPHQPNEFPPPTANSSKTANQITREIRFLQIEEYNIRLSGFNKSIEKLTAMIDFLNDPSLIPTCLTIKITTEDFFKDLLEEPEQAIRLQTAYVHKIGELCNIINKDFEGPSIKESLLYMFGLCIPKFNNSLHFMELNSQQDKFNQWLFSPMHPNAPEITAFLETFQQLPRRSFTGKVFELFAELKKHFPQSDPMLGSILVLMYVRAMFDAAISINFSYFFQNQESKAKTVADKILISDLTPPPELLPQHKQNEPARIVFMRDNKYRSAGQHITAAFFQTNPLDVLYEIHLALRDMHIGIASRRKANEIRQVLPFETIFSVFFGSLLTADLPNLEELVKFIIDFAPAGKLAPEFQYAQVTMTAVVAQFDTFIHDKNLDKNIC